MALSDLLRAIEAEAEEERVRAEAEAAATANAIVEEASRSAASLEAELAAEPEAAASAERGRQLAVARLSAAAAVRVAREEAFTSVLAGVRAELAALRGRASYPVVFRALLAESRAALPAARELHADGRDLALAAAVADDLTVVATLDTWGGLDLADKDGRIVHNTVEVRLANGEPQMRARFARRLATATGAAGPSEVPDETRDSR